MIRVAAKTADKATAWRVRDALARHPLLGGAVTHIEIEACREMVLLDGWVLDEGLGALAKRIAMQEAGRRCVLVQLNVQRQKGPTTRQTVSV